MTDPVSTRYKDALRLGHLAVVKGRPREAIGHYEQAGELVPDRPLPFISMGNVYLQMRQPQEALAAFDQALERAPSDLAAMHGKAAALEAAGRAPEAGILRLRTAELEAMVRAGQRRSAAVDPVALELEQHVANGAAARIAGDLDIALAAYLAAANGYALVNDFDAAIDACLRALEARPGNIDVHFTMAMLYLRQGWTEHGQQRVVLIERRLDIDDDPRRRAALHALARDFRTLGPQLERLASARP
ncbi:MAG TPA: tetratricopeptide repeat protein [Anaerolineae bacterium]|jgi:tetratricopeptide (TPR) repeat protein|nr:tetratricopeptide repeat protein [Anaerolineae bacterium]